MTGIGDGGGTFILWLVKTAESNPTWYVASGLDEWQEDTNLNDLSLTYAPGTPENFYAAKAPGYLYFLAYYDDFRKLDVVGASAAAGAFIFVVSILSFYLFTPTHRNSHITQVTHNTSHTSHKSHITQNTQFTHCCIL